MREGDPFGIQSNLMREGDPFGIHHSSMGPSNAYKSITT